MSYIRLKIGIMTYKIKIFIFYCHPNFDHQLIHGLLMLV